MPNQQKQRRILLKEVAMDWQVAIKDVEKAIQSSGQPANTKEEVDVCMKRWLGPEKRRVSRQNSSKKGLITRLKNQLKTRQALSKEETQIWEAKCYQHTEVERIQNEFTKRQSEVIKQLKRDKVRPENDNSWWPQIVKKLTGN